MHKVVAFAVLGGLVSVVAAVIVLTVGNPSPAPFTPRNIYSNLTYQLFNHKSESEQQWFVDDILAQAQEEDTAEISEQAYWDNKPLEMPFPITPPEIVAQVLQATVGNCEKVIEIDLSEQRLFAKECDTVIYEMKTSTGKKWTPTPTGEYRIWIKVRKQKMSGGSKLTGDYYYLPNVPHVMFFNKGYGIHGAYWHNNFGNVMSHGCVNLSLPDAEKLYNWAEPVVPEGKGALKASDENPGTRVVIYD